MAWPELLNWRLDDFFAATRVSGQSISPNTETFVRRWIGLAQQKRGELADDPTARELVRVREQALKKSRSRFINRAALGQWSGASGVARLDYRWGTVKTFMTDLAVLEETADA